ncbi:MAG: PqiC family protein [Verrucomicrobiota bacterium]
MNTSHPSRVLDIPSRPRIPGARTLAALLCSLVLTSCSFMKPVASTSHYYVLTPDATTSGESGSLAVGLGQVKLPAYLFNTSLAIRRGTNEVDYLESAIWAERPDAGVQRVLAADLAAVLPTDQLRTPAWQKNDVALEVYVAIDQFDVDAAGRGVLVAQWRILSPGGERILKSGISRLSRPGPSPDTNISGAVATLSDLLADLSRQLAQALKETPVPVRNSPSHP